MKHILFFTIIISLTTSCFTNKGNNKTKSEKGQMTKELIVDKEFKLIKKTLNYTIESASISGNILTIKVNSEYKDFNLYFNGMYAKSLPPQATLFLVNTTENDSYDTKKTLTLNFDISKAKYYKGDKTIIIIYSYPEKLTLTH